MELPILAAHSYLGLELGIFWLTFVFGAALFRLVTGDKKVNVPLSILGYCLGIGGFMAFPWNTETPSPWNTVALVANILVIAAGLAIVSLEAGRGHGFFADWRAKKES